MEEIIIPISEAESLYVERLFFEYNAMLNILNYLSSNSMNPKYFEEYFDKAAQKHIELEIAKEEMSKLYAPPTNFNKYSFDFNKCTINYYSCENKPSNN